MLLNEVGIVEEPLGRLRDVLLQAGGLCQSSADLIDGPLAQVELTQQRLFVRGAGLDAVAGGQAVGMFLERAGARRRAVSRPLGGFDLVPCVKGEDRSGSVADAAKQGDCPAHRFLCGLYDDEALAGVQPGGVLLQEFGIQTADEPAEKETAGQSADQRRQGQGEGEGLPEEPICGERRRTVPETHRQQSGQRAQEQSDASAPQRPVSWGDPVGPDAAFRRLVDQDGTAESLST